MAGPHRYACFRRKLDLAAVPRAYVEIADQHHALYNLYLLEAIRAFAQMQQWASSRAAGVSPVIAVSSSALTGLADALAAAINRHFWDARRGLCATTLRGPRSLVPQLAPLPESPIARATWNGRTVGSR